MHRLDKRPRFTTGVAAEILNINPKTLINYENSKIMKVDRNKKGRRLYSEEDLFKILVIKYLIHQKSLSFDGVKLIFDLRERLLNKKPKIDIYDEIIPRDIFEEFIARVS